MLRQLKGKRVCVDFQKDIDGPQTAARLIKETLQNFGVIFKELNDGADAYVWTQGGSQHMRFAFVVAHPTDKGNHLCYECGPRELTASIMTAIHNFFFLPRTTLPSVQKTGELISSLDTVAQGQLSPAEDEIVRLGEQIFDALLASVNACNRKITAAALAQDWVAAKEGMKALERRIRVLGRIRSSRSIPAILDAFADSAEAAEYTGLPEARSLCKTTADALFSIGQEVVPYLKANINDKRLLVRKAVHDTLSRLQPKKWWRFWK
jgi:hypothetical protein